MRAGDAWWHSAWRQRAASRCAWISPPTWRRRSPNIFASITRSSAASRGARRRNFLAEDWHAAQLDSVARIELYELRVARCVAAVASRLQAAAHRRAALGRHQARLRNAGRAPPRQRFLPHVFQFRHARSVRHGRRQQGSGVLRHHRRPRFRLGADPGLPCRRISARGGARNSRRPAVQRRDRQHGRRGTSHQRGNRPLFRHRAAERRARIHRVDRAGVLSRHAGVRGRPRDRRRRHHAAGAGLHHSARNGASRRGDAVARRRRIAVRLCAQLLSRRSAGGQRGDHAAALLHAAQVRR